MKSINFIICLELISIFSLAFILFYQYQEINSFPSCSILMEKIDPNIPFIQTGNIKDIIKQKETHDSFDLILKTTCGNFNLG